MFVRPLMLALLLAAPVLAVEVEGVLPASLDQPRIYMAIGVDAKGPPLVAKATAGALADLLGGALDDGKKHAKDEEVTQFAIEAFLDTGASDVMLSKATADGLGIKLTPGAKFHDVGVGGGEAFDVAGPFFVRLGDYSSNTEGDDLATYSPAVGPLRIAIRESAGLIDEMTGGVDLAGMPAMLGKVIVCDCRPVAKFDKLKTTLVAPGDKSIPAIVDSTIALTYVDFARFTRHEPASGPRVSLAASPMIGPNPFDKKDAAKPVTITRGGKTATLTMLLDTGAASSMISTAKARELGIVVDESGKLTNVPAKEQFTLPIGGIGATKDVHGFYVDVVELPVARGEPIRYRKAPLLVTDVSVRDEKTGETYTLDGVFGMNYLVASADVSTGLDAGVDDIHDGAFDGFVIDHSRKTLGLKINRANADVAPEPNAAPATRTAAARKAR